MDGTQDRALEALKDKPKHVSIPEMEQTFKDRLGKNDRQSELIAIIVQKSHEEEKTESKQHHQQPEIKKLVSPLTQMRPRLRSYVIKRNGEEADVNFDKITKRLKALLWNLDPSLDVVRVTQQVIRAMIPGIRTSQLDEVAADEAAALTYEHSDYAYLAGRIKASNLQKLTDPSFTKTCRRLYENTRPDGENGMVQMPLIRPQLLEFIEKEQDALDNMIKKDRDFKFDYFAFQTLENQGYLSRVYPKTLVERPQTFYLRLACAIWQGKLDLIKETYEYMSNHDMTQATPSLLSLGRIRQTASSCYLLIFKDDSIAGIHDTWAWLSEISKGGGGIGVSANNIRCDGSYIRGTDGTARGVVPLLNVVGRIAAYVDQGGGKRKGAIQATLEPWHPDLYGFLALRDPAGPEDIRARNLNTALWIPNLFMKRIANDEMWSFFCPHDCPKLNKLNGKAFEDQYEEYERQGLYKRQERAQDVWQAIMKEKSMRSQPFIMFKDHCNDKSNQKYLGNIRNSNLCCEIVEYSDEKEIAVCTLGSISVANFLEDIPEEEEDLEYQAYKDKSDDEKPCHLQFAGRRKRKRFNFPAFQKCVRCLARNLNRIIDIQDYPVKEAGVSHFKNRPIGIGIQGLADAFAMMGYPFDSREARLLNKRIFESLYFAALWESKEMAKREGVYPGYPGCPVSQGILQFDMWDVIPLSEQPGQAKICDWPTLRKEIRQHGVRNSLLVAPMPTATTSQLLGRNECFEPFTSNLHTRRTLAGDFICMNKYLMADMQAENIPGFNMKAFTEQLKKEKGSVQDIDICPSHIKKVYRTAFEIPGSSIIEMAIDRGPYIDQSQSMNLWQAEPDATELSDFMFQGWEGGLKTGNYYNRLRAAVDAVAVTVPVAVASSSHNREETTQKHTNNNNNDSNLHSQIGLPIETDECPSCSS